jgi:hypothetical protein
MESFRMLRHCKAAFEPSWCLHQEGRSESKERDKVAAKAKKETRSQRKQRKRQGYSESKEMALGLVERHLIAVGGRHQKCFVTGGTSTPEK